MPQGAQKIQADMTFNDSKPIYLQIVDIVCDKIAAKEWLAEERIPSVRELGGDLEVNPNTVMRAYEWLSEQGITYNKRGIGFFVSATAMEGIVKERRAKLLNEEVKSIAQRMKQLDVSIEELTERLSAELQ